jgi:aspartyl-tRNA(Asn)/glutamyl-tRNA(Gln) amidotransferase subunit C
MSLDLATVHRVALLARLDLSPNEEQQIADQLGSVLNHFERLAAADTTGVAPTSQAVDLSDAYREDLATNPLAPEAYRANAPARDGNLFKVPKIIE